MGQNIEIRPGVIRAELVSALKEIEKQADEVKRFAAERSIEVYSVRDTTGNWVYIPLLVAKANALAALASYNSR